MQMELIQGMDVKNFLLGRHVNKGKIVMSENEWNKANDQLFQLDDDGLKIQPGIAIHMLRSILRGLEILHNCGFVHCDIKPANVMLNRQGMAKIIDFGRAVKVNEPLTYLLGTPLYMAPETHHKEPIQVQSDLFSVGLVAMELLCGRQIHRHFGKTETEQLAFKLKLGKKLPDLLPEYVRKNEVLVNVLRKMLQPNIEDRFPNALKAESGDEGLQMVHKQLVLAGKDTQYDRALSAYLYKVVTPVASESKS